MKKTIAIITSALAFGFILVPNAINTFAAEVTEAQAQEIALNHAGVAKDQIAFIQSKLDYEHGSRVYEVEFYTKDYKEYDYEIEVSSGSILSFDYDAEYYDADHAKNQGRYLNGSLKAQTNPGKVSLEEAKKIALDHAGISSDQATFLKTDIDYEDRRQVYDLEFYTNDSRKFNYDIDTETGSVVSYDFKVYQGQASSANGSSQTNTAVNDINHAKEIAAAHAGLKVSDVIFKEIEYDFDDGYACYEGEFIHGTTEYEFTINVSNGAITEWGSESIYD